MPVDIFAYFYLPLLLFTAGIAVYRWRVLSIADKWMCVLMIATLIEESFSKYYASTIHYNFFTYHIYTLVELFLISLYFDRSIGFRKPYLIGIIIGACGVVLSLINTFYFQSTHTFNSYFLLFEGVIVLSFCLLSFYRLLIRDNIVPGKMAQFWLTICFMFYQSLAYANNGVYGALAGQNNLLSSILDWSRQIVNLLFYFGIALVFIRYKKLIPSGE